MSKAEPLLCRPKLLHFLKDTVVHLQSGDSEHQVRFWFLINSLACSQVHVLGGHCVRWWWSATRPEDHCQKPRSPAQRPRRPQSGKCGECKISHHQQNPVPNTMCVPSLCWTISMIFRSAAGIPNEALTTAPADTPNQCSQVTDAVHLNVVALNQKVPSSLWEQKLNEKNPANLK